MVSVEDVTLLKVVPSVNATPFRLHWYVVAPGALTLIVATPAPAQTAAGAVGGAIMTGNALTVKVFVLVAVPALFVTDTVPVVPEPITAIRTVPELDVIEETGVPPMVTPEAVTPDRLVPLIVIEVPTQPLSEPKLVIVGNAGAIMLTV